MSYLPPDTHTHTHFSVTSALRFVSVISQLLACQPLLPNLSSSASLWPLGRAASAAARRGEERLEADRGGCIKDFRSAADK